MSAPRSRRRRIRLIVQTINALAITALDNEQDGTIWETSLSTFARALPLDAIADESLSTSEAVVCSTLEDIEVELENTPTESAMEAMVDDLKTVLMAAGL